MELSTRYPLLAVVAVMMVAEANAAAPAAASASGGASHGSASHGGPDPEGEKNDTIFRALLWSWAFLIGGLMTYTAVIHVKHYMRTIACLNYETQRYFAVPNVWHGNFKRLFWDAPLI